MGKKEIIESVDPNGYLNKKDVSRIYDELIKLPDNGRMLEIGTGAGHSATFFAKVRPDYVIYTVDAYGNGVDYKGGYSVTDLAEFVRRWKSAGLTNIVPIVADSVTLPWELKVDFIYIDGDHTYKAVEKDFNHYSPYLRHTGFMLFDDYKPHRKDKWEVDDFLNDLAKKGEWEVEPLNWLAIAKRK